MNCILCNCQTNISTYEIVKDFLEIAVSIANIIAIIYIFYKEQKNEEKRINDSNKKAWYESLDVRKNAINFTKMLCDEVEEIISIIASEKRNKKTIQEHLDKINDEFLNYKNMTLIAVECLDNNDYKKRNEELNNVQEKICNLSNIINMQNVKNLDQINCLYKEIIKDILLISKEMIY